MNSTAHQAAQGDNMVNNPEELGAWLRLVLTPGVGPESARRLLAAFGEPQAIFAQTETALCQVVSAKQAQALRLMPEGCADLTQDTLDWLQAGTGPGRCVLTLGDADYPTRR
jgi:DNA processing protein